MANTVDERDAEAEDDTAGTERQYIALNEALADRNIPLANHDIIRRAVAVAGIERYTGTSGYIKAYRAGGGPVLRIAYGYTNGFVSREEALSVGNMTPWRSGRRGLWGIEHPENSILARTSRPSSAAPPSLASSSWQSPAVSSGWTRGTRTLDLVSGPGTVT